MNSPIGTPSHWKETYTNPRAPSIQPYKEEFTGKVPLFEAAKPDRVVRAVDKNSQTIGEMPPIPFMITRGYRDKTPQIDTMIEYLTDLVVGTDMNINADDDDAKALLERFANDTELYLKARNLVDSALEGGTSVFVRAFKHGYLDNIEEFDMTFVKRVIRDMFGNPLEYIVLGDNGVEERIKNIKQFVPIVFRRRGRDYFGRSMFHTLAVTRTVGHRTMRPIIEGIWAFDDSTFGTMENYAHPIEYHIFEEANLDDLEKEAHKYKDRQVGDAFFTNKKHEIQTREPARVNFEPFFEYSSDLLQMGTGFPLEILLGDFTSRASSQTTDSLLMRRVKAYQKQLTKIIKKEILEVLLKNHPESRWQDDESIAKLNINVEFETQTPMEYTPDQVLSRVNASMWTKDEGREYDKANGQDLFDDDKIAQEDEERKQMEQDQMNQQEKPPQKKERKTTK